MDMKDYKFLVLLCVGAFLQGLTGCGSPSSSDPAGSPNLRMVGTVSATTHHLVAKYSFVSPAAGTVNVEFGTNVLYGRSTGSKTVTAGQTVDVLVAGMRPNTTYHMRARLNLSDGTTFVDSDKTFTTGALPQSSFPNITVTPSGPAQSGGVELISGIGENINVTALALDTDGIIIWYYYDPSLAPGLFAFPIRELDNGNFLINFEQDVREVNLSGQIIRQITLAELNTVLAAAGFALQAYSFHHDVIRLSNGHWILLVNEYRTFQDLPGYPGTTSVLGDAIVDLDTSNQPVWVWRAFDHLDVNRHPYMFPDWTHSNGLVYKPDGSLLLSMRHQSWILKVDYANGAGGGDVLWRLGPDGDFTLTDGDPSRWFYNQHFPNLLQASGTSLQLALFDNGNTRPDGSGQACMQDCYSRAVIMNVDESALAAQISWQYSPGWFSDWGGSIVRLSNGDIEFDSSTVQGNSRVVEVTSGSAPQTVWEMDSSNSNFYRAYRIPSLYPDVAW
jgi:hypothetical protein